MAKLYPPYLEGTLPAFCLDNNGDGVMTIPFALNKAVSISEIAAMAVKIKTVQNDVLLGSITLEQNGGGWELNSDGDGHVDFNVKDFMILNNDQGIFIREGMHYKVQLAFIDKKNIIGYYSTVGVIKCTSKPMVFIQDFSEEQGAVNNNRTDFIGQFIQAEGGDVTEKVYSSKFTITDLKGNIIYTTGDVLHNTENNPNSYSSQDYMTFNRDLNYGEIYRIQYEVTTTNGLKIASPNYLLTQQKSLRMEMQGDLVVKLNYDEGYIDVQIAGFRDNNSIEEIVTGAFILTREDSINPGFWEELTRFSINHEAPSRTIFRDFTIEQGKTYTYSLQQFNQHGVFSDRKKSKPIRADFEDMFLYDGERQLKLRFNPQVSSFKTQLSETRSETIGNKYPFFFRNARIGYKVFPVSGLISMFIDDNQFFDNYEDILRDTFPVERHNNMNDRGPTVYNQHNLLKENFASERLFKLSVLDWLNDGKVKLFRSPGEGNYLVRMMDTSLSPNAIIGRMLHTVSSTAYECAKCDYSNLVKYNIIKDAGKVKLAASVTNWREESLTRYVDEETPPGSGHYTTREYPLEFDPNINDGLASDNLLKSDDVGQYTTTLRFIDLLPGTKIKIIFDPDGNFEDANGMIITIGSTGNYYADDIQPVYGIYLMNPQIPDITKPETMIFPSSSGRVLYQYETSGRNEFDSIVKMEANIGAYQQFVGPVGNASSGLVQALEWTREQATKICMSNYVKRPVEYLYFAGGSNQFTTEATNIFVNPDNVKGSRENAIENLFWDLEFTPIEVFNDKESMEYSPFSIYVIKNMIINGESIANHAPNYDTDGEHHYFEKYYIDRIMNAQTPQETLTAYTLAYKESIKMEEGNDLSAWLNDNPLYVVDAWTGEIFTVGEEYLYTPSIIFNGEEIDLREIERYSLDDLDAVEANIIVGNGVYGEVFYQKITAEYTFEELDSATKTSKAIWEAINSSMKGNQKRAEFSQDDYEQKLIDERNAYIIYNNNLARAITSWTERVK